MQKIYPKHLYDATRRKIAVSYLQHELRKLFPSIKEDEYFSSIDKEVAAWFSDNPTLTPVRDFWNGVHGISMGFRLKHIAVWLTSTNMEWKEQTVAVKGIKFGTSFKELSVVGKHPSVEEVRDWYFDPKHSEELEAARKAHKRRSAETADRDTFPVILRKLLNDDVIVMDGNRRLLRAVLFEIDEIKAFVGTQTENPPIKDHWVSTSLLLDLVSMHKYWTMTGKDSTDFVAKTIASMIEDSEVARFELTDRCVDMSNPANKDLFDAVTNVLGKV